MNSLAVQSSIFPVPAAPSIALRPYQVEAVRRSLDAWRGGLKRLLLVLPTGAGKTIVFAELARLAGLKGRRTLILAHREELLQQAIDKLRLVWRDARIGLVRAESRTEGADITVASVQSLHTARLERLAADYGLVVIDETHHAAARSYKRILARFPSAMVLGVTATPGRADGRGLKMFEKTVYHLSIPDLVRDGYLVPIEAVKKRLNLDLDQVRKVAGDFDASKLGDLFGDPALHLPVVGAWKEARSSGCATKALVFCAGVRHADDLAAAFRRFGVRAEAVSGGTPRLQRQQTLQMFHRGDLEVLTNCNVLTEGFDEPSVDCLLMVRPTLSQGLYIQMVGRGLRLHPGKEKCLVIDFAGTTRHRLIQAGNFLKDQANAVYANGVRATRLHWTAVDGGFVLPVQDGDGRRHAFRLVRESDESFVALHIVGGREIELCRAPLGFAQGQAEESARAIIPKDKLWMHKADARWRQGPPSDKQVLLLNRLGLEVPATKGEAGDLITKHFAGKGRT